MKAPREVTDPDDDSMPTVVDGDAPDSVSAEPSAEGRVDSGDQPSPVKTWFRATWSRTRQSIASEREKRAARAAERASAREAAKQARAMEVAETRARAEEEALRGPIPSSTAAPTEAQGAVTLSGVSKSFGDTVAVASVDLDIPSGSFYGIVGPNGAGKTTTLSMITGLLRPDSGTITVGGTNVWDDPPRSKRMMGTLPDRMRLFDRLTGAQLLYYSGVLRGLDNVTVRARVKSLTRAFGLEDAVGRLVSDYSAGMSKKIALACALIHSPRVLVLDEPFESVDPVSAASITDILQKYVENGGTVILSSHGMDFIERVCDNVAIIVGGELLAQGTIDDVRNGGTLEERFISLVGGRKATEDLEWLHSFSD